VTARNNVIEADDRTLVIERTFDAPVELLWKMWTEQEHIAKWSCPRGFTIPEGSGDLRVGGQWRCCMVAPDGAKLWLGGVYREIVPLKRLVMTHVWDDETGKPGHETIVTVHFEAQGQRTRITLRQTGFDSAASRDGHTGGWSECLDKLAELLVA